MSRIIAITGGIGSGKSVVSRLLRVMGYTVYDCDERAKYVMTHDAVLRSQLTALFGPEAYLSDSQGRLQLNRPLLSARIFADQQLLSQMNACVHPAVARDMRLHIAAEPTARLFFYESAILYESGFEHLIRPDEVWTVSAPLELRIARAMQRDGATHDQVISRINSQLPQEDKERRAQHVILNDDRHSVIAQVRALLAATSIPTTSPC